MPKKKYYYVVKVGYNPGIYETWNECKEQIDKFKSPVFKKFSSYEDAECFLFDRYDKKDLDFFNSCKGNILSDLYNPDTEYELDNWNKYDKSFYIFTDGSQTFTKDGKLTRLGVYIGENLVNISENYMNSTNNRCEIKAIKYSLEIIFKNRKEIKSRQLVNEENEYFIDNIYIISDSEYCVKSCSNWIYGWQKNGWITSQGKEVKNKDLYIQILLLLNKLNLHKIKYEFKHVNSHQPPPLSNNFELFLWRGNQIADYLAQDKL